MEGPRGGPSHPSPLFLDQTEARRAEKNFLEDRTSPYLRVWMTAPPPPPLILKVWIRHCHRSLRLHLNVNVIQSATIDYFESFSSLSNV